MFKYPKDDILNLWEQIYRSFDNDSQPSKVREVEHESLLEFAQK